MKPGGRRRGARSAVRPAARATRRASPRAAARSRQPSEIVEVGEIERLRRDGLEIARFGRGRLHDCVSGEHQKARPCFARAALPGPESSRAARARSGGARRLPGTAYVFSSGSSTSTSVMPGSRHLHRLGAVRGRARLAAFVLMTTSAYASPASPPVRSKAKMPASSSSCDVRASTRRRSCRRGGAPRTSRAAARASRSGGTCRPWWRSRVPEHLAVGRIVAAREVLLGAVVEARDALLGHEEDERVAQRVLVALRVEEEARDVVVVHEVHERLGSARRRCRPAAARCCSSRRGPPRASRSARCPSAAPSSCACLKTSRKTWKCCEK